MFSIDDSNPHTNIDMGVICLIFRGALSMDADVIIVGGGLAGLVADAVTARRARLQAAEAMNTLP